MRAVNYDKHALHLYFTDNQSSDHTVAELERCKAQFGSEFGDFEIIDLGYNAGFGKGSNSSAQAGHSDFVFFYNVDTAIDPNAFAELERVITTAAPTVGAFELRQLPYEHPKYYHPVTMEVSWASGAAVVLRREVFEKTGGFDETIWMYCEDVDLSWRIRLLGYTIQYVPSAMTQHFIGDRIETTSTTQLIGTLVGDKILRMKFGSNAQLEDWNHYRCNFQIYLDRDPKAKSLAQELLKKADAHKHTYRRFYKQSVKGQPIQFSFGGTYCFTRLGALYQNILPTAPPSFTVIIRTFRRPEVLRLTLQCLENQTYKQFRVIVVEDGEDPVSESVVTEFEARLEIQYLPLRENAGRCKAGNIGLSQVTTDYAVFLDDDDYFFADYFEVAAKLIEEHPDCKMFCSSSLLAKTIDLNQDGSEFEITEMIHFNAKDINTLSYFHDNPTPIQAVLFQTSLFREYGGFDLEMDAFEDWELWIRYASHCKIASTEKTLSLFKVPADPAEFQKRSQRMEQYRPKMYEKMAQYSANFTAQEIYSLFWKPESSAFQSSSNMQAQQYKTELTVILNSTAYKVGNLITYLPRLLKNKLFSSSSPVLEDETDSPLTEANIYLAQLNGVQNSFTYRLGRFLTWLPRTLKTKIRTIFK